MAERDGESSYRCPGCGGTKELAATPYNGHSMARCASCSLLHTREREFPASQYDSVYAHQSAYRSMINVARRTHSGEMGYRHLWWFKKLGLHWLEGHGKGRLLDVGCGPGTFLLVARQRGWDVTGVEPAGEPADLARSLGVEVFKGSLPDFARQSPRPFWAITSFEVMEHVPQPAAVLRAMRDLLLPGGRVVISVPNLDDPYCLRQKIPSAVPPVHINFFDRRSLAAALRAAGLDVLKFFTLPIPTSSVRNVLGTRGFAVRAPLLLAMRAIGRSDGTTLVALGKRA